MRIPERDVTHWDAQHDVVVVGLGCAGAAAAIEAGSASTGHRAQAFANTS